MIYAISDLHISNRGDKPMNIFGASWNNYLDKIKDSWNSLVSDEDIVLLAGDLSWAMSLDNAIDDLSYIESLKGKKIIIRGNHDYWWNSYTKLIGRLPDNVYAIQNNAIKIGNNVFCGTRGWINGKEGTEDDKKIYHRELLRLELTLNEGMKLKTEDDKLYLMTHFPPYSDGFLPSPFTEIIDKYPVDSVIYGHIHGTNSPHSLFFEMNGVKYYLTSCDMVNNTLVPIE